MKDKPAGQCFKVGRLRGMEQNDVDGEENIAAILLEDIRAKQMARPKPRAIGKQKPRRIMFPGDFVDKRTDSRYRSGPVIRTFLTEKERILLAVGQLPSWDELREMSKKEQLEIMRPLVARGMTDREMAQLFGDEVRPKDVANRRQSLGLKKLHRKGGRLVPVFYNDKGEKPEEVKGVDVSLPPVDDIRMRFSVGGKYTADMLSRRLMSIATLLSDEGFIQSDYLYEVKISIVETNEQQTAKTPAIADEAAASLEEMA
jgi:hypothetical protein